MSRLVYERPWKEWEGPEGGGNWKTDPQATVLGNRFGRDL